MFTVKSSATLVTYFILEVLAPEILEKKKRHCHIKQRHSRNARLLHFQASLEALIFIV